MFIDFIFPIFVLRTMSKRTERRSMYSLTLEDADHLYETWKICTLHDIKDDKLVVTEED